MSAETQLIEVANVIEDGLRVLKKLMEHDTYDRIADDAWETLDDAQSCLDVVLQALSEGRLEEI